ncbi:hypothetical protein I4J48_18530 [Pseudonocardia sp. KRD-169]|nr:hypothetical protein [Pseudonocardia abyssalis]
MGPGTGWIPGTPWSGRTPAEGGTSGLRAGPAEPAAPARPGAAASSSSGAQGPGTGSRSATGGTPFFPAAGAGRGEGSEHTRPSWLVEDDPQAYWFSGLPDHTAGVIGGEGDSDH